MLNKILHAFMPWPAWTPSLYVYTRISMVASFCQDYVFFLLKSWPSLQNDLHYSRIDKLSPDDATLPPVSCRAPQLGYNIVVRIIHLWLSGYALWLLPWLWVFKDCCGRTWDHFVFVYFLSQQLCLIPPSSISMFYLWESCLPRRQLFQILGAPLEQAKKKKP